MRHLLRERACACFRAQAAAALDEALDAVTVLPPGLRFLPPVRRATAAARGRAAVRLAAHLQACAACAAHAAGLAADRARLRALRDRPPVPPRDLWARTAAALDREAGEDLLGPLRDRPPVPPRDLWARTAAALDREAAARALERGDAPAPAPRPAGRPGARAFRPRPSAAAVFAIALVASTVLVGGPGAPLVPDSSPIPIEASEIQLVRRTADGALELQTSTVSAVCPRAVAACATEAPAVRRRVGIGAGAIDDVLLSPTRRQLVLVDRTAGTAGVYVVAVDVLLAAAGELPGATARPATRPAPGRTAAPSGTGAPVVAVPSLGAAPGASLAPAGADRVLLAIAPHVIVMGAEAAWSPDGTTLAFSARPDDGSLGPDVWTWRPGWASARRVTADHGSLFAGWLGSRLLVSRVAGPAAAPEPADPADPADAPDGADASASPGAGAEGEAEPAAPGPDELEPVTVVVDPATGEEDPVLVPGGGRMFLPTLSPSGRAIWWDGTVVPAAGGHGWVPATGRLVLGAWFGDPSPEAPEPVLPPLATPEPPDPGASPSAPPDDPLGQPGEPEPTPAASAEPAPDEDLERWQVRWDPTGSVVAVWKGSVVRGAIGRLAVYRVRPDTGQVDLGDPIVEGLASTSDFTLGRDRLVWAAPADDGERSVHVVAWSGDLLGELLLSSGAGIAIVR